MISFWIHQRVGWRCGVVLRRGEGFVLGDELSAEGPDEEVVISVATIQSDTLKGERAESTPRHHVGGDNQEDVQHDADRYWELLSAESVHRGCINDAVAQEERAARSATSSGWLG